MYATLPIGESNRMFSVQTPSDRSIDYALIAWQSGTLQSQGARFCIQSFSQKGFHSLSVRVIIPLKGPAPPTW